eukprot:scaffold378_cov248-Pinguiococcus_pyrenoidosus.AAC.4
MQHHRVLYDARRRGDVAVVQHRGYCTPRVQQRGDLSAPVLRRFLPMERPGKQARRYLLSYRLPGKRCKSEASPCHEECLLRNTGRTRLFIPSRIYRRGLVRRRSKGLEATGLAEDVAESFAISIRSAFEKKQPMPGFSWFSSHHEQQRGFFNQG